MKLQVINTIGKNTTTTVSDQIFAQPMNNQLLAQAVRVYIANQHIGTSKVKTRSEVVRTKRKWYRQKGTGNARHGARSAHIFVGGGVAHGPKGLQKAALKLSRQMKHKALMISLSAQVKNVVVCDDIEKLDGKTASGDKLITAIAPKAKRVLVVLPSFHSNVTRSLRNLERVLMVSANKVNALDVSMADTVIVTKASLKALEDRLMSAKKRLTPVTAKTTSEIASPELSQTKTEKVKTKQKADKAKKEKLSSKSDTKKSKTKKDTTSSKKKTNKESKTDAKKASSSKKQTKTTTKKTKTTAKKATKKST